MARLPCRLIASESILPSRVAVWRVAGRSGSANGIPTPASQGVNVVGIGGYNTPAGGLAQARDDDHAALS
jgi:hypothetical protein